MHLAIDHPVWLTPQQRADCVDLVEHVRAALLTLHKIFPRRLQGTQALRVTSHAPRECALRLEVRGFHVVPPIGRLSQTEDGGDYRTRTDHLLLARQMLSQHELSPRKLLAAAGRLISFSDQQFLLTRTCIRTALLGGARGNLTPDLSRAKGALSQLSYSPETLGCSEDFETSTSRATTERSASELRAPSMLTTL